MISVFFNRWFCKHIGQLRRSVLSCFLLSAVYFFALPIFGQTAGIKSAATQKNTPPKATPKSPPPFDWHLLPTIDHKKSGLQHKKATLLPSTNTFDSVNYFAGIAHGEFISYFPSGNPKIKCRYLLGEIEGPFLRFYPDGKLAASGAYQDDAPHGYWKNYYPNGNLASEGRIAYGKSEGTWRFYHPNGQIKQTEERRAGLLYALDTFYSASGDAYPNTTFKGGFGIRFDYYSEGSLKEKSTYYQGYKQGKTETFANEGQKTGIYFYQKNTLHGPYFRFYPNGKTAEKGFYFRGKQQGAFATYDTTGNLREKGKIWDEKKQGLWLEYEKNTKSYRQITYRHGKIDGQAVFYDAAGNISEKGLFKDGKKHGLWKTFYPSGQVLQEKNYVKGILHGQFVSFRPNGKPQTRGSYHQHKKQGKWLYFSPKTAHTFLCEVSLKRFLTKNRKRQTKSAPPPFLTAHYDAGRRDGRWTYRYANGKIIQTEEWQAGRLLDFSTQKLPNGKVLNCKKTTNTIKKRVFYDINGKKYAEGAYKAGLAAGLWRYFDEKEKKIAEGKKQGGKKTGIWYLYEKQKAVGEIDFDEKKPQIRWLKNIKPQTEGSEMRLLAYLLLRQ